MTRRLHRLSNPKKFVLPVIAVVALVAASCGGSSGTESSTNDVNIVDAGTINIELPDQIVEVEEEPTVAVETSAGSETAGGEDSDDGAAQSTDAGDPIEAPDEEATDEEAPDEEAAAREVVTEPTEDPDAIPLEQEEAGVSDLLNAFDALSACLDNANYPEDLVPSGPDDQETLAQLTEDQLDTLIGCAAQSQILQTLEDVQASGADRTAQEIEADNEGTLHFVDCARGIGWTVSDPTPDQDGALQLGTGATDGLTAPDGEDFTSPGFRNCVLESERISDQARAAVN